MFLSCYYKILPDIILIVAVVADPPASLQFSDLSLFFSNRNPKF